jgi:hypothetical protein
MSDSDSDSDSPKQSSSSSSTTSAPGGAPRIKGIYQILPYVYMSDADAACNKEELKYLGKVIMERDSEALLTILIYI